MDVLMRASVLRELIWEARQLGHNEQVRELEAKLDALTPTPFYIVRVTDLPWLTMRRSDDTFFTSGAIEHMRQGGIILKTPMTFYMKAFMNAEWREIPEVTL